MTPGNINKQTRVLVSPNGTCSDLSVRLRDGTFNSVWYPTKEEIELMRVGQPVKLTIWGDRHPPVSLNVDAEEGHTRAP
jgi:hypothetical protein